MKLILSVLICASVLLAEFKRSDNEVVFDTKTGLLWQDDNQTTTQTYRWSDAISHCEALNHGGFNDWRLPNINELLSIADRTKTNPTMDSTFQYRRSSNYWSSTTYRGNSSNGWRVYMNYGYSYYSSKSTSYYVRCVRGGQ